MFHIMFAIRDLALHLSYFYVQKLIITYEMGVHLQISKHNNVTKTQKNTFVKASLI